MRARPQITNCYELLQPITICGAGIDTGGEILQDDKSDFNFNHIAGRDQMAQSKTVAAQAKAEFQAKAAHYLNMAVEAPEGGKKQAMALKVALKAENAALEASCGR
jgi:hypothetical protein